MVEVSLSGTVTVSNDQANSSGFGQRQHGRNATVATVLTMDVQVTLKHTKKDINYHLRVRVSCYTVITHSV